MTELKTLNEINTMIIGDVNKEDRDVTDYVNKHRLKQEAIKWINKYREYSDCDHMEPKEIFLCNACNGASGTCVGEGICKWIMHFFNISEEDLK